MTDIDLLRGDIHLGDFLVAALRRHRDRNVLQLGDVELTGAAMAEAISTYVQAFAAVGAGSGTPVGCSRSTVPRCCW